MSLSSVIPRASVNFDSRPSCDRSYCEIGYRVVLRASRLHSPARHPILSRSTLLPQQCFAEVAGFCLTERLTYQCAFISPLPLAVVNNLNLTTRSSGLRLWFKRWFQIGSQAGVCVVQTQGSCRVGFSFHPPPAEEAIIQFNLCINVGTIRRSH